MIYNGIDKLLQWNAIIFAVFPAGENAIFSQNMYCNKIHQSKPLFPPSRLSVLLFVRPFVRHTSAFHPINSSRCLNSLIKVAPYVLGVDPWGSGSS